MLAVFLDENKSDARLKIIYALEKKKGYTPSIDISFDTGDEDNTGDIIDSKHTKEPIIDINDLSDHLGLDLSVYVNDIRDNYFKRSQTKGWIMNYPEKKMVLNKKKEYPKSISIPAWLKCFITPETQAEIIEAWYVKYTHYVNDKDIQLKFK